MPINKLSKRLEICAGMVSKGCRIADIGTDHAYLPIFLAKNNLISGAIASDVNTGPLKTAQKNIKNNGLEKIIKTRISEGLKNIYEDEVDEIIIAGMGGNLISEILDKCNFQNKFSKKFILQPMTREYDLRLYLCNNGYFIENEKAVYCKNKVYTVMHVKYTNHKLIFSETYYYIGMILKNYNKDTKLYIEKQIRDLKNKKNGSHHMKNFSLEKKYDSIIRILESILH
ncbi:MAG: class I SAM-dependent methyltransferase [Oscillospiraceae bacterium]|jgi:tRNA (adenine22-N1)-methyltransferase|nr:class I SAM-dependent methyltransferase [Oscillospiraceae bacterium]